MCLVAGLWMVIEFKSGIVPAALQVKALATAIGIVFLAEGVVNAFVSLAHRSTRGWGWGLTASASAHRVNTYSVSRITFSF
jgi:uncharacterized membrane protein HdeD (DUF308 family)